MFQTLQARLTLELRPADMASLSEADEFYDVRLL